MPTALEQGVPSAASHVSSSTVLFNQERTAIVIRVSLGGEPQSLPPGCLDGLLLFIYLFMATES